VNGWQQREEALAVASTFCIRVELLELAAVTRNESGPEGIRAAAAGFADFPRRRIFKRSSCQGAALAYVRCINFFSSLLKPVL